MRLLDLDKLCAGLSRTWTGVLRDWDRTLRAANHPATTLYLPKMSSAQVRLHVRTRGGFRRVGRVGGW
ncbi:hypothetical protein GCM10009682_61070 [Luedemannella flava]|uniref:Uncharacterized protein n=1 Tax=Luedemannella flava TaxID=349316 RepID=A0ABP4Z2M2_9ACTN